MIDKDGFRANVGIILCNEHNQVLWAQRARHDSWQFPQGGIKSHETPEEAVYRELMEEVGLQEQHVEIIGKTNGWLRYRLPKRYLRYGNKPLCIGQKQRWFLLQLIQLLCQFCMTRRLLYDRRLPDNLPKLKSECQSKR